MLWWSLMLPSALVLPESQEELVAIPPPGARCLRAASIHSGGSVSGSGNGVWQLELDYQNLDTDQDHILSPEDTHEHIDP